MSFLRQILGDPENQQRIQDFINRYQQGPPEEGYSGEEVVNQYQQVAPRLAQQDYVQAAQAAFSRMTPEQRSQFMQYLQQQAQQQNVPLPVPAGAPAGQEQDPGILAQIAGALNQQQPGGLAQLLGGGGGAENPVVKAVLAGITALAAQKVLSVR